VKKFLVISMASLALVSSRAYATSIGGDIGFGHYWASGAGVSGLALGGHVDIPLSRGWSIVPAIELWTGSEDEESITDVAPAVALKYAATSKNVMPFYGAGLQLHILSAFDESTNCLGLSGFGGIAIPMSPRMSFPLQASYGLIFGGGSTVNVFIVKAGITAKL
jgi:hypothetical protein